MHSPMYIPHTEVQQVSFTWPHGPFSFPKTFADCPLGFTAGNNCVLQDNENYNGNNNEFVGFCLVDGRCTARDIRLCYCTQQVDTSTYAWPNGDYCIARFGGVCPAGFSEGELFWDDENSSPGTSFNGAVPDGVYNANTRIFYCCRNDGSAEQSILLPTDDPFILYAHSSSTCQAVFNMRSHSIELFTDDENNNNQNSCTGSHPFDTGCGGKDHRVHLCLYY